MQKSTATQGVISTQATIEMEKMFWPLKIQTPCVPCYIVPIPTVYAKKLFDENLANTNLSLFPNENTESALSIENIYYKSKYQSISRFPARILWYVRKSTVMESNLKMCQFQKHRNLCPNFPQIYYLRRVTAISLLCSSTLFSANKLSFPETVATQRFPEIVISQ